MKNQCYLNNTYFTLPRATCTTCSKKAILEFSNHKIGPLLFLERLKYDFDPRSKTAKTHITQVTKENQIVNEDDKGLLEFYYTLSDCLIILQHLNYEYGI